MNRIGGVVLFVLVVAVLVAGRMGFEAKKAEMRQDLEFIQSMNQLAEMVK